MSHDALGLRETSVTGGTWEPICHLEREKALILTMKREMSGERWTYKWGDRGSGMMRGEWQHREEEEEEEEEEDEKEEEEEGDGNPV